MTLPISVIIPTGIEYDNLPKLFETIKEADEKIVIAHLNDERTIKVAKELGAKVYRLDSIVYKATQEDVDTFTQRYGFKPIFTAGNTLPHSGENKNREYKFAKNDWCFQVDCDERVHWDVDEIKSLMEISDVIPMRFNHTHDPQGNPIEVFDTVKLSRKSKTWWQGRTHEALVGYDVRINHAKKSYIDHWQVPKKERAIYLPSLEFAYLKDQSTRCCYFLAREYFNYEFYDKALKFFGMYLKTAYDPQEISKAYEIMAACYWRQGKEAEAHVSCFHAIRIRPNAKEPLLLMADMSKPKDSLQWKKFAEVAEK